MKKFLFIVAIVATGHSIGYSQQHITTYYDPYKKFKEEDYFLDNNAQMHGKYTSYFRDGSFKLVLTYIHGKVNGKGITYYFDGGSRGIASIANYKDDEQDGLQQYYFDNAPEPSVEGHKPYVVVEELYQGGSITWRKMYDFENGKRFLAKHELIAQGITKGYLPNGHQYYQIAVDGVNFQDGSSNTNKIWFMAKDGKKNGLYKEWFRNGQIADSCYYLNDLQEGVETGWYDNGGKRLRCSYVGGKKSGIETAWHINGALEFSANYTNGKIQGRVDVLDPSGVLISSENYIEGDRQLSNSDVHRSIDLIRNSDYSRANKMLALVENAGILGYDSAVVALGLFMDYYIIDHFGYSENLIFWIMAHHPTKLTANDYIKYSNYLKRNDKYDPSSVLDSAIKNVPDDPRIQFLYAHNRHAFSIANRYNDDSYKFYEIWMSHLDNGDEKVGLLEAKGVIMVHDFNLLKNTNCNTEESKRATQKIKSDLQPFNKLNVYTDDIIKIIKDYEDGCKFEIAPR
ncbi:hypothetical protein CJD36_011115 [Flavipsychrobacter stenotrophus]|uniref:Antitoxin component YwqK of the YwqJK toxin-antitoxin module n=1 Tax=Flavipsychrobacter stenotrophus TaxID=2077091 RepID=A0A2S7SUX5_9BACT|nr:toxin-antitoxin system YwqK family antitoxin [Flavipsychrobacter stenotrophus]PQJ10518.1 hypothetical protein CJD36_011115 [Flavipsychrobacter stenotrophus]